MKTTSLSSARVFLPFLVASVIPLHGNPDGTIEAVPLAARDGVQGRMLFTAIEPAQSGLEIENPYDDPRMWGELFTEFSTGAIGTGVAVADVDGDGLVDLFVVNKTRPDQLFRQVAPFRFEDVTDRAGVGGQTDGAWKTGATFADVNNDGYPDLYVCRFGAPNRLYLNDGSGRFEESGRQAGLDLVSGSVVGAFEDFDRDGWLDVFVVTNLLDARASPDGEVNRLFRNRGDGTFEDVSESAGISRDPAHSHSASWFDHDGDGWVDLYVANDFAAPDFFYRNNGDGTFTDVTASRLPHTPWFSMGSDAADLNNDGLVDFIVADMAGTTHFKSKVTMGDMGGIVDQMDRLVTPQYMKNAVFVNSGTDRFWEVAKLTGMSSTDWTWSLRFEDFDQDGRVDLHVTNGMVRSFTDSDLLNRLKRLQSPEERAALVRASPALAETNLVFRNEGDLRFRKVQKDWGLAHTGVSFGSATADFDGDGDLDLVYTNLDAPVSLYRNDGDSGSSVMVRLRGTHGNRFGIGAEVRIETGTGVQTRRLTVARGALSSSEPVLHFGLGGEDEVRRLEVRWPSGHVQSFPDLAAGFRYLVTEPAGAASVGPARPGRPVQEGLFRDEAAAIGIDFINVEPFFNDMTRQSLLPHRMNTLGAGAAWGDANGDGAADLFLPGAAGNTSALYLNDGRGRFARSPHAQPWDGARGREEMAAVWIDLDRDGALDLVVSAGSVEAEPGSDHYRSRIYLNDGEGRFAEAPADRLEAPLFSAGVLSAADYDRDGDLDLFIGGRVVPGEYPTAPLSALLENRDGRLVDVTDVVCSSLRRPGMVTAALWTDVDRDGAPDLLLAGEWMSLRLFLNRSGTFVEGTGQAGLDRVTGWWNSLTAADVNRDGAIDYIAGNVGLNTKYHANDAHPAQIYYVDFEGTGKPQIIEGKFEGDNLYPVRGRSCSSLAMPSLKEKFPTFNEFATALLPEIYTPEKLENSLHLTANELASGVFLNDGQGHFDFHSLPRMAQTAPIFGIAAADFNGDGHPDLFLAQNFHGPQVETGRYDGGLSLLLLGDGTGSFTPTTPGESGVAIGGEARAAALADWNRDGRPDLLVTRINERAVAFVNRGRVEGRSLAVRLKGRVGNPDAIGARVTARFADGSVEAAETFAGSGHLSQAEPLVFFGYAANQPPVLIEVNWPDGFTSRHPFEPGAPRMVLTAP